jgi:hypothetical protein
MVGAAPSVFWAAGMPRGQSFWSAAPKLARARPYEKLMKNGWMVASSKSISKGVNGI